MGKWRIQPGGISHRGARWNSSYFQFSTPEGNRARIVLQNAPTHFGHYSSRVNRIYNEDRYYAGVLKLPAGSSLVPKHLRKEMDGISRQVFNFAVFDGHGGHQCSDFLAGNLAKYVETCNLQNSQEIGELYKKKFGGYWRAWSSQLSKYFGNMTPYDDLQMRLPISFLQADYDFCNGENVQSGSTCTSVYLYSRDKREYGVKSGFEPGDARNFFWNKEADTHLVVAQVGDTRCILVDKYGTCWPLTSEHHPSSPVEATRLRRFSSLFFTDSFGEERFDEFANTRSFGDIDAKSMGISAEPEVTECRLGISHEEPDARASAGLCNSIRELNGDEAFLVLMSDGVSGMMSDEEIADLVIFTANQHGSGRGTPQEAAVEVIKYVEMVGGDDNATCLVVRLGSWGDWVWTDRTGGIREGRMKDALDRPSSRTAF